MNKRDIIVKASKNSGIPQATMHQCFEQILEAIKETLTEGHNITIANFGSFRITEKKEKRFTNPSTGVYSVLPKKRFVKFKTNKNIIMNT